MALGYTFLLAKNLVVLINTQKGETMKISKWGLNVLLATNLGNTSIFEELLSRVSLQRDEAGNIPDFQVDNIKTTIKVALRISAMKGEAMSVKLKKALESLLDYGSEESSDNIRAFLNSPESSMPLIIMELPTDNDCSVISRILMPLMEEEDVQLRSESLERLNFLLGRVIQDFSD